MIVFFRRCLFFILFLSLHGISLHGQSILKGRIEDKKSHEALIGAVITCKQKMVLSDNNGEFEISCNPGKQIIFFHYTGYTDINRTIDLIDKQEVSINIQLTEANILLDVAEISSSRFEKPITESPISIDIIKPISAERINAVSADQVIDRVPGVQIIDGQANIRGGSGYSYGAGSRVMLIMDDLQILQPDAGFTNWGDLPLENVGQIEIVKGAASALYGSAAMNGIIHFRTIKPSLEPYTSLSFIPRFYLNPKNNNQWWGNGNHVIPNDNSFVFAHRKRYKKNDLTVGATYRNKTSYNKNENLENFRLNVNLTRHVSDRLIVGLGFNFNAGKSSSFFYWDGDGSYVGAAGTESSSHRVRFNLDPSVQYFTSKNFRHRLLTRWLHIDNKNDNNQSNSSENLFTEYQIQKNFENLGLVVTGGVLYNYFNINAPLFSDTIFNNFNYSTYLQAEKKLFSRLNISAGMRYELFRTNGPYHVDTNFIKNPVTENRPVFRFGLNYKLFAASFLRASFGQGFRFPTLAEKYIRTSAGGFNIIPNYKLQSEYGSTYEIGLKQGLKLGNYQGFFDVSYFYSKYQDMIEFTLIFGPNLAPYYQAQNVGDTRISGVELSHQGIVNLNKNKISFNAGITFLDPKFQEWDLSGKDILVTKIESATRGQKNAFASTSSTNILKYRSKELARIDVEYQYMKFFAGVNFTYASNVEAVDKLFLLFNGIQSFRENHNHGYRVYDFRIGSSFSKCDVQLNLQNAFNEVYTNRPGLMEAPRNIGGRVVWKI